MKKHSFVYWCVAFICGWLIYFFAIGIPVFHLAFGFHLTRVIAFVIIGCVVNLLLAPLFYSARRTDASPRGDYPRAFKATTLLVTVTSLGWIFYLKAIGSWPRTENAKWFFHALVYVIVSVGLLCLAFFPAVNYFRSKRGKSTSRRGAD